MVVESNLVKKLSWVDKVKEEEVSEIPFIKHCKALEDKGYGMLEDKNHPGEIDENKVVLPDNTIVSTKDIEVYLERRNGSYCSQNDEDVQMHNIQLYHSTFVSWKHPKIG
jgi:hypothetical protein